jgi:hypothetical protein
MDQAESKRSNSGVSGKLLIVGIVIVALGAAATSWYFRYIATHHAARFWGSSAILIRDAPQVTLSSWPNKTAPNAANNSDAAASSAARQDFDVSEAHGLTHLRNALLEDFNFAWPGLKDEPIAADDFHDWTWILEFRDPKSRKFVAIQFTQDCTLAARVLPAEEHGSGKAIAVPTAPAMAKGLREMFAEFTAAAAKQSAEIPAAAPAR